MSVCIFCTCTAISPCACPNPAPLCSMREHASASALSMACRRRRKPREKKKKIWSYSISSHGLGGSGDNIMQTATAIFSEKENRKSWLGSCVTSGQARLGWVGLGRAGACERATNLVLLSLSRCCTRVSSAACDVARVTRVKC